VVNIPQRGKLNAWNKYVHSLAEPEAEFLIMMDADIRIQNRDTLWNMIQALRKEPEASVAVDRPLKDLVLKKNKSVSERISLAMSGLTRSAKGQLCGQLYAIRAKVARNIYLPRDLAVEDGFIKALVTTDFLTKPVNLKRIVLAKDAEHTFEAYTTPKVILKNQKRQIMAQTLVHLLVDKYLKTLPEAARRRMAETLLRKEQSEPEWLKQILANHLREARFFWRLYPALLTHRLKQVGKLPIVKRPIYYPAALLSCAVLLPASFMAWRTLSAGSTDYWPKAQRGSAAVVAGAGLRPA
jgi:hypothetical protein